MEEPAERWLRDRLRCCALPLLALPRVPKANQGVILKKCHKMYSLLEEAARRIVHNEVL